MYSRSSVTCVHPKHLACQLCAVKIGSHLQGGLDIRCPPKAQGENREKTSQASKSGQDTGTPHSFLSFYVRRNELLTECVFRVGNKSLGAVMSWSMVLFFVWSRCAQPTCGLVSCVSGFCVSCYICLQYLGSVPGILSCGTMHTLHMTRAQMRRNL